MALWRSTRIMCCYWMGCIVIGIAYALFMWDGSASLAFVVGQIAMGAIGLAREAVVAKQVRSS